MSGRQRVGYQFSVGAHQQHHIRVDSCAVVGQCGNHGAVVGGSNGLSKSEIRRHDTCRLGQLPVVVLAQQIENALTCQQIAPNILVCAVRQVAVDNGQTGHLNQQQQQGKGEHYPCLKFVNFHDIRSQ